MKCLTVLGSLTLVAALGTGCSSSRDQAARSAGEPATGAYVLASQPAGAKGVAELRQSAKDGDSVVVTGRVGGDAAPFIEGAAAFTIVDPALEPCPPDEGCPTPWDYCCDVEKTAANKAMIKVVDARGRTVTTDARTLFRIDPLDTVVVRGRAKRDDAGNLTVLADGVYVSRSTH